MSQYLKFENEGLELLTLLKAVSQTADHIMITDITGTILYVNPAFEKTTGYCGKEILGQNPRILQSGQQPREYYDQLWKTILSGNVFSSVTTNRKKSGEIYCADQSISPVRNERGEITHFVSVWKDVTERIRIEKELNEAKKLLELEKIKLEQVLHIEDHINSILNLDKLVDFIVSSTAKVLEAERCSLMFVDEHSGELCVKGYQGPERDAVMKSSLRLGDPIAGTIAEEGKPVLVLDIEQDKRFFRSNRVSCRTKSFVSAPIKLGNNLIGVLSATDKISKENTVFTELDLKIISMICRQVAVAIENAKLYRELKFLTITDPMTNMYNYRYFTKTLDHEINRVKRFGGDLCIMMVDIDNFKSYNDEFGHLEGDQLLRSIATLLTENIRDVDVACRYAGDEFVLILPHTKLIDATLVANKLRSMVEELELKRKITLSIGVAQYALSMNRHDLILKADTFLYSAKKEGKNKIVSES